MDVPTFVRQLFGLRQFEPIDRVRDFAKLRRRPDTVFIAREYPVNPSGTWSPRQAARVLSIISEQAKSYGIRFEVVEVTTMGGPRRVLLVPHCVYHARMIGEDAACDTCMEESQ